MINYTRNARPLAQSIYGRTATQTVEWAHKQADKRTSNQSNASQGRTFYVNQKVKQKLQNGGRTLLYILRTPPLIAYAPTANAVPSMQHLAFATWQLLAPEETLLSQQKNSKTMCIHPGNLRPAVVMGYGIICKINIKYYESLVCNKKKSKNKK